MALIKYNTGPQSADELGPGVLRRQRKPNLFEWVGRCAEPRGQTQRNAFARMAWLASLRWWTSLSGADRLSWYDNSITAHRQRPGGGGNNTGNQPFSRFITNCGHETYHGIEPTLTAQSYGTAYITHMYIDAWHAPWNHVHIAVAVAQETPPSLPYQLTVFQRRPGAYRTGPYTHCKLALTFNITTAPIFRTYWLTVPLPYIQPHPGNLYLYVRCRDRHSCRGWDHTLLSYP
jgi:hypothetical protein